MTISIIRKIIGAIETSICNMFIIGGLISLGFRLISGADCKISIFFYILITTFIALLGCIGIYHVNSTLWDDVNNIKEKGKNSVMNLLPDIKAINDFLEYVGNIWK